MKTSSLGQQEPVDVMAVDLVAMDVPMPEVTSANLKTKLGSFVLPTLAITGACLAVVATASTIKRGSPWAGINSIAAGLGLTAIRPSREFDPVVTLAGIGTAIGGAVILAGVQRFASRGIRGIGGIGSGRGRILGRVLGGAITSAVAVTLDKLFMRDAIFPAFANALGIRGTVAKYASIGAAAALASR